MLANSVLDVEGEQREWQAIEAEAIGWLPLTTEEGECAYLHVGDPSAMVITVVGVPDSAMAGMNVLLVG